MASQQQVRETITNQIVAALESSSTPPWRRPWRVGPNAGSPANVVSRKAYRGIDPEERLRLPGLTRCVGCGRTRPCHTPPIGARIPPDAGRLSTVNADGRTRRPAESDGPSPAR